MTKTEELLDSIRRIALADFLGDPKKVLGLLELLSPTDCDNAPIFYSITLGAGETLDYLVGSPDGFIAINTDVYYDVEVAKVLDIIIYLDGKPYVNVPDAKATAGGVWVQLYPWGKPCTTVLYHVYNGHTDSVTLFVIGSGAYLQKSIWEKLKKTLNSFGEQMRQEGMVA